MLSNAGTLAALRFQIPLLFSHSPEVVDILVNDTPLMMLMQASDTLASFPNCPLRGLGYRISGGYVNIVALYVVALPPSLASAFGLDWQLYGLWAGWTAGSFLCVVLASPKRLHTHNQSLLPFLQCSCCWVPSVMVLGGLEHRG